MRIGISGVGYLGAIHLECIKQTPFEFGGFYDPSEKVFSDLLDLGEVERFSSFDSMLDKVDAVIISNPTTFHFETAQKAIDRNKHIFIEKPACETSRQIVDLINLIGKKNIIVQVGYVERFNPAFEACREYIGEPKFIEVHRLSTFTDRANDVSVIMDLMIHDIDIILSLVKSEITEIKANGVCLVNDSTDIANVRIEFGNGCVANLTASRISMKKMRKMRIFQNETYIGVDYLNKKCEVLDQLKKSDSFDPKIILPPVKKTNAITEELLEFFANIEQQRQPRVGLEEARKSTLVAEKIMQKISANKY